MWQATRVSVLYFVILNSLDCHKIQSSCLHFTTLKCWKDENFNRVVNATINTQFHSSLLFKLKITNAYSQTRKLSQWSKKRSQMCVIYTHQSVQVVSKLKNVTTKEKYTVLNEAFMNFSWKLCLALLCKPSNYHIETFKLAFWWNVERHDGNISTVCNNWRENVTRERGGGDYIEGLRQQFKIKKLRTSYILVSARCLHESFLQAKFQYSYKTPRALHHQCQMFK